MPPTNPTSINPTNQPTPQQQTTNQPANQTNIPESTEGDIKEQETLNLLQELKNLYQQTTQHKDKDFETPETKSRLSKTIIDSIQLYENKIYTGKDTLAKKRLIYLTATTKTVLNKIFGADTITNLGNNIKNILDSVSNIQTILMDLSDIKIANKKIIDIVSNIVDNIVLNNIQTITKNTTKTVKEVNNVINKSTNLFLDNQQKQFRKLFNDYFSKKGFFDVFEYSMNQIYGSIRKGTVFGLLYNIILLIKNSFIGLKNDIVKTYINIKEYFDKHHIQKTIVKWLLFSPYAIGQVIVRKLIEREKKAKEDLIKTIKEFQTSVIKKGINIEEKLKNYFSNERFERFFKQSKLFGGIFKLSTNIDILRKPVEDMSYKELKEYVKLMKKVNFLETIQNIEDRMDQAKTEEEKEALEKRRNRLIAEEVSKLSTERLKKVLLTISTGLLKTISFPLIGAYHGIKFTLVGLYKFLRDGFGFLRGIFSFGGKVLNMFSLVSTAIKTVIETFGKDLIYKIVFTVGFVIGFLSKLINSILDYFKDENGNFLTIPEIAKKLFIDITKFIMEFFGIDKIYFRTLLYIKEKIDSFFANIFAFFDGISAVFNNFGKLLETVAEHIITKIKNLLPFTTKKELLPLSQKINSILSASPGFSEAFEKSKYEYLLEKAKGYQYFLENTSLEYQKQMLEKYDKNTKINLRYLSEIQNKVENALLPQTSFLKEDLQKYVEETRSKYDAINNKVLDNISEIQIKLLRGDIDLMDVLRNISFQYEYGFKKNLQKELEDFKDGNKKIEYLIKKYLEEQKAFQEEDRKYKTIYGGNVTINTLPSVSIGASKLNLNFPNYFTNPLSINPTTTE